jgi:hypothetical protein
LKSTDKKILTSTWQEDMATMMDTGEKIFNHEHFRIKSGMCLQFLRTFKLLKKKNFKKKTILKILPVPRGPAARQLLVRTEQD